MRHYRTAAGAATAVALVLAAPATASAHSDQHGIPPITTFATGLDGPRQLSTLSHGVLLVAESDSGEVSSVDLYTGKVRTLLSGLGNPQGVDAANGLIYVAVGEAGPPPEEGAPPPPPRPAGEPQNVVLEATPDGKVLRSFDLLAYEKANNPDGQVQLVNGQPVDALSNPFSVLAQKDRLLVADAGANDVLSIDLATGAISTFFVPPVITGTPECATAENNPGTVGCDPVPTEITQGPDGLIYVGTLGAEAPGAARVYVLDQHGKVLRHIDGLTSVTGVAVGDDRTVYVSNVIAGAPEGDGPPPAGFDPATVGNLTRISPDGSRAVAEVTMPAGLEMASGTLYSTAWAVASFANLPNGLGEVQRIGEGAFARTP
ncbi:ScyD/ScyE family protein [Blastococcus sp. TML/M2B]|uniref:ScyD/ScyE family protein n=1 Tax=unclassified Blastococcus TaxID=2619396 RepID=UPI00190B4C0B|nr:MULTISPECIES: ScyD/ScyE family protein [unclassified Blastococcus]MBN1093316.1 ScyD/ScyE family protein [Blastococcus sp. TML/M2B]MBN1096569.1 ScyD/ScyE family protein [Blastococcus sp. TML/C7B]